MRKSWQIVSRLIHANLKFSQKSFTKNHILMANNRLSFNDQVAIVTGAGGGLGREYALLLADRGASVVVNDLGGTRSGEGQNKSAADRVVDEIKSKGGKAVADYNSVEDGDKIVKTAIDNFGRIDIVINNAGILRDKSFLKLGVDDWDLVHKVHLRGSFLVTRAAWPYFRKQNYGRIIVTSSGAGIYGNFGQANYSSAKLGLLGLSNTLAIEGAKYGIHCNTIIPLAASRLTQDIFPEDWFEQLKPEFIAPVVVYLCHSSCSENGGVIESAGGWVGKYRWQRSIGKAFVGSGDNISIESVRDNWQEITDMTDAVFPTNVQEQTTLLLEALTNTSRDTRPKAKKDSGGYSYNHDHAILYSLGVGLTTAEPDHLKFLYEGSDEFQVLPTFGSVISMHALLESSVLTDQLDGINADPTKMVHGEHFIEIFEPLPPSCTLTSVCKATAVLDKGAGALAIIDVDSFNEQGMKVMNNQFSIFFLGAGNFGGPRSSDEAKAIVKVPSRQPDAVVLEKTMNNQAALFRLCGDKNPLHIDPSFAAMGGFQKPIMHGLCTYGYAARHVLKQFANNDVKKFKTMKARFSGPIEPGHTIKTDMWREGNRIIYQCMAIETGKPLVTGGYVDLDSVTPLYAAPTQPQNSSTRNEVPQSNSGGGDDGSSNSGLISDLIFAEIGNKLKELPDIASKVQAIYEWNITKNGKPASQWILDLKNGAGGLYRGPIKEGKAHCTLIIDDDDMLSMVTGKLDARKAFMSGRLKIKGNIMLTQKLQPLLAANRGKANIPQRPPPPPPSVETSVGNTPALKSENIFVGYQKSLERNPQFVEIQHIYQWNITRDGKLAASWTFDLKNGKGAIYRGVPKSGKADCILTLDDDLMVEMSAGRVDPQKAFMTGKLKIQGDVLASEKLHDLREDFKNRNKGNSSDDSSPSPSKSDEPPICVKSDIIFELFGERLLEEPDIANKMKVVYHWNVLRDGKKMSDWTVDLKTGSGSIYKDAPKIKADCILTLEDEDTIKLLTGKLNPQRAFMTGKLKIKGNIMLTQKLNQLWQEILKSGRAIELPLLEPILCDKALDKRLYSEYAFLAIAKKLARNSNLVDKVRAIFEWNVTKDGKKETTWTVDMKKPLGAVYRGPSKSTKATCVITIDDKDFSDLVFGKLPSEKMLKSGGRVKITGDTAAAERIIELFKVSPSKL